MKKKIIIVFSIFFLTSIYIAKSQESHALAEKDKNKRYYTFNIDPFFLHFQYEGKIKNNFYIGVGAGVGMGVRPFLRLFPDGKTGFSIMADNANFEFYLSQRVSKTFHHSIGIFTSIQTPGEGDYFFFSGFEYSLFYGFKTIKIGQRLQFGLFFENIEEKIIYPQINITPLVIQIKF